MSAALFLSEESDILQNVLLKDCRCIFTYDNKNNIDPCEISTFDPTEILNFSGDIIVDCIENALYIINNSSNCRIYFLCNSETGNYKKDLFSFIRLSQNPNFNIVLDEKTSKEEILNIIPERTTQGHIMTVDYLAIHTLRQEKENEIK